MCVQITGCYYAVDNGVWFTSAKATGPWAVADSIPKDEIAKIPPSSPVYNTTYVNVYESTPEVVYTGYTPGYLWSYPYYGVPVYGTHQYTRPSTRPQINRPDLNRANYARQTGAARAQMRGMNMRRR